MKLPPRFIPTQEPYDPRKFAKTEKPKEENDDSSSDETLAIEE